MNEEERVRMRESRNLVEKTNNHDKRCLHFIPRDELPTVHRYSLPGLLLWQPCKPKERQSRLKRL